MLFRQRQRPDPMGFLAGDGEMARRIRERNWSAHSFGPPEIWPQSLRSALGICLNSAFPTAIYWGPELRLLYNDAWAPIPGPRHPAALGAPAREVWSDIWHVIEPQFVRIFSSGEGLFVEDQMLPMQRFGAPERTWWTYNFTPIRDEEGSIGGVFNSGSETTRSILIQQQMRLLLDLAEALRSAQGADEARKTALAMLGTHLGADRAGFAEVRGAAATLVADWRSGATGDPAAGAARGWSADALDRLRAGEVVRGDTPGDGHVLDELAAVVAVPWREAGALVEIAFVGCTAPRHWNDVDVGTVEEVLERTRSALARQRGAERERIMMAEIDHRARNALAVAQAVVRLTRADDVAVLRDKIGERITALADAHGLLAAGRWEAVDLAALVEMELAPYAGTGAAAATWSGPRVALGAELAQSLALVLHELATNAAKHGALGRAGGGLALSWRTADRCLELDWTESLPPGSPPPAARPDDGFGATLLSRVVRQIGGTVTRDFASEGLRCRLVLPLDGAAADAPAPPVAPAAGAARRVMIVEDDAIVAMDLEGMVRALGLEVFGVFHDLEGAVAAVASAPPDLAVLDANLRGRSSVPLAERLHGAGVPVVFATGYSAIEGLPAELAAAPVLVKPIDEAALREVVVAALR